VASSQRKGNVNKCRGKEGERIGISGTDYPAKSVLAFIIISFSPSQPPEPKQSLHLQNTTEPSSDYGRSLQLHPHPARASPALISIKEWVAFAMAAVVMVTGMVTGAISSWGTIRKDRRDIAAVDMEAEKKKLREEKEALAKDMSKCQEGQAGRESRQDKGEGESPQEGAGGPGERHRRLGH